MGKWGLKEFCLDVSLAIDRSLAQDDREYSLSRSWDRSEPFGWDFGGRRKNTDRGGE